MVASVCSSLTSIVTHFRHSEKRRRYECTNFVIWTYEFQRWTQPVKAAARIVASFKKLAVWNAWNRAMIFYQIMACSFRKCKPPWFFQPMQCQTFSFAKRRAKWDQSKPAHPQRSLPSTATITFWLRELNGTWTFTTSKTACCAAI